MMIEEQAAESKASEAMRAMREAGAVVRIDVEDGHRIFIEAVTETDGRYGLVDHYEVRKRGSHVTDSTSKRDGLWVLRELSRNEFVLVR